MKLKLNEDGFAVVQDGKPVYIDDEGKEFAFDAVHTKSTISRLNGEAKSHRERAEAAENALKSFEGIEDPAAAIKALSTVKNLDDKKLVEAGKVEEVKAEIVKTYEAKLKEALDAKSKLEADWHEDKISGAFARSKFISDQCAVPADLVQSRFARSFKVEDGKLVGVDQNGQKLYSSSRPGEYADFDEAISQLIGGYQYKDQILKGSAASGAGARNGSGNPGVKTMNRSDFEAKSPAEKAEFAKSGGQITD